MKGRLTRSLAISLAAHTLLFLSLAFLLPHSPVVFTAPSITFVEAQTAGSGGAKGSGDRKATPKAVMATVPAAPAVLRPATLPKAPVPQAQAAPPAQPAPQAPATLPAPGPAASAPASPGANGPTGDSGANGTGSGPGSGSGSGSGNGTTSALEPATDADPQTPIADIDPTLMGKIEPSYPPTARRLGQQGLVKVETEISAKGFVIACRVAVSSGFPSLDNAALNEVQSARFFPAMKGGKPVASKVLVPIRFQLKKP